MKIPTTIPTIIAMIIQIPRFLSSFFIFKLVFGAKVAFCTVSAKSSSKIVLLRWI